VRIEQEKVGTEVLDENGEGLTTDAVLEEFREVTEGLLLD
jgi:hypothetical protein